MASSSLKWENDIRSFENKDRISPPVKNGIVVTGSSSIRLWTGLEEKFKDHHVVNRGFGGALVKDILYYCDRIVLPYKPDKVFMYAGGNDLIKGNKPANIANDFKELCEHLHRADASIHIYIISVMPHLAFWSMNDAIVETNDLIKEFIAHTPHTTYVDFYSQMIQGNNPPDPAFFLKDRIHLSERGYTLLQNCVSGYIADA